MNKGTFSRGGDVNSVMRPIALLLSVALLVGMVGCKGRDAVEPKKPEPVKTAVEHAPTEGTTTKPPTEFTPPPANPGAYDIKKPGEDGWKGTLVNLSTLGTAMDESIKKNRPTNVETVTNFDDPDFGSMRATPTLKIQDPKTFLIIYMLPEDKGNDRWLIGDGKRRVRKVGAKWQELPAFNKPKSINAKSAVKDFPMRFGELMFAPYLDGSSIWGPLLSGWQDGLDGYKATIEEQQFTIASKPATHYRIIATKPNVEVEMIVDKARLLPLTVRVKSKRKDGKELKSYWTGNWRFGGKYEPKEFKIPLPAKGK